MRDIETIKLELLFADMETVEKRIAKVARGAKNDKGLAHELELLEAIFAGRDDHAEYAMGSPFRGVALYGAKMAPLYHRIDGKSANVQYAEDTVRVRPYEPRVLTEKNPGARRVKDRF